MVSAAKRRVLSDVAVRVCRSECESVYDFRSSRSNADLLAVASYRTTKTFNRSGATRAAALDIPKVFDRVWHAGPMEFRVRYLALFQA